jgi:SAM-dependent methyltransferase
MPYDPSQFSLDAFAGTARFYLRHRIPYPPDLIADLLQRSGADGSGRLLDLASGPGRATFPMASSFREVHAVDRESEMIEVGREEAVRRGIDNIRWSTGDAEDFEAAPGSFDLVTIADAFHRLDQPRISELALRWLRPGGGLAILGGFGFMLGEEPWQRIVGTVVRKWVDLPPEPQPGSPDQGPALAERVMREAGFEEVASHPFACPHAWTDEGILGNLYSTSFCSQRFLGGRVAAFAEDLTSQLLAADPSGIYPERARFGYTFGRKPARRAGAGA